MKINLNNQEQDYKSSQQHVMKTKELRVQNYLPNIISKHYYHNPVSDDFIWWAIHVNRNNTYFDKNNVCKFYHFLNVIYNISPNDSTSGTKFCSHLQILLWFHDKELMNPFNLLLTNLSDKALNVSDNIISEVNDSDWHTCTNSHFNDVLGINHNEVICGIFNGFDIQYTSKMKQL